MDETSITAQNKNIESLPFEGYAVKIINSDAAASLKKFDLYKLFWIFLIGSVFGFVVETIWCFIKKFKKLFEKKRKSIGAPIIYRVKEVKCKKS